MACNEIFMYFSDIEVFISEDQNAINWKRRNIGIKEGKNYDDYYSLSIKLSK